MQEEVRSGQGSECLDFFGSIELEVELDPRYGTTKLASY